mmetsp:Transcript_113788/g.332356  ORF Transcript_113788/g.332356 Transcript_113788/m.332356 type:complete len:622 (+) Transcript_113788:103-1968(+)
MAEVKQHRAARPTPTKISPWASWAEWKNVYNQLSSPEVIKRWRGVQRVQTWRSRGNVPVSVDLTACFVEIMLNDATFNPEATAPRSDYELQLMYSMAMVRLVNGIVDAARRGGVGGSIAALAQELEWPQWFVALRHEATHMSLASVSLLRLAAKEALWLLFERFWRPQLALLDQRGAGSCSDGLGRTEVRAVVPPRDQRLLDQRLKGLVRAARRGPSETNIEVPVQTAAGVIIADTARVRASALSGLAPDEARLLRSIASTLAVEPSQDGQEVRALHLLCAHCSDNFSLRFARYLLERAFGWSNSILEPTADNAPSLRNACDTCLDQSCSTTPDCEVVSIPQEDATRMLHWLEAMLDPCLDGVESQHFTDAVCGLLPHLQSLTIKRIAAAATATSAGEADMLTKCATLVWQALGGTRVATACDFFTLAFHGAQASDRGTLSGKAISPPVQSGCRQPRRRPHLSDIEDLLRAQKRQRVGRAKDARVSHEPWTSIGTVLDLESLSISCRLEADTSLETRADAVCAEWASDAPGQDLRSVDDSSGGAASAARGHVPTPEAPGSASSAMQGMDRKAGICAEAEATGAASSSLDGAAHKLPAGATTASEYRQQVAALMAALKPFSS